VARLIEREAGKPSRLLHILGILFAILAIGAPALLGVSFFLILISVLSEEPDKIWTSFFLFGVLVPLAALVALLWAEVVLVVRLVRWRRQLEKDDTGAP
jgi:hypothetical protein